MRAPTPLRLRGRAFDFERPILLGVLNVTPDSFSDGGRWLDPERAAERARELARDGADWLDLGAESTRPGAEPIGPGEQLARLLPVIDRIRASAELEHVPLSVDTRSARVLRACLDAGADLLNDVSGLEDDPDMPATAAAAGCPVVVMHKRGEPRTMQDDPRYDDVVAEVRAYLAARVEALASAGVARVLVDPGIGFGKTLEHNVALLRHLGELAPPGVPLVVGASRKRFLGALSGVARPEDRDLESVVAGVLAATRGAHVLRVHDVGAHRRGLAVGLALQPPQRLVAQGPNR